MHMPRCSRNFSNANFFHTIVQGIEKLFIFDNPSNMLKYLNLLKEKSKNKKVRILSYCIMHNHAHILIYASNINDLSTFYRRVNTSYAQYFNAKNSRVGYVFRNRFYSEPIHSKKQLINTINYIHNNPIKAHLCDSPVEYNFCSYSEYFYNNYNVVDKKILFLIFKDKDIKKIFD